MLISQIKMKNVSKNAGLTGRNLFLSINQWRGRVNLFDYLFCWDFLKTVSLVRRFLLDSARIWTAKMAAFLAPAFPMATVATGTPGGIWIVLSKASIPSRPLLEISGTPMTGRVVRAARAPAK